MPRDRACNSSKRVGRDPNNAGIYLDVFVDGAEIHNNVSVNMPRPARTLMTRGWVVLVMSKNTRTYSNGSDRLSYKDFDPGRYRFFWHDRSNVRRDNHTFRDLADPDARDVAERAGLEPEYAQLVARIDTELDLGNHGGRRAEHRLTRT